MSLVLTSKVTTADLTLKIRDRISAGAPVWESSVDELPTWLADEIGQTAVKAVFQSPVACVAILANGGRLVRRLNQA